MKRIILVLIVLANATLVFSQGVFRINGGATVRASQGGFTVINGLNLVNNGILQQSSAGGTVKFAGNNSLTVSGTGTNNFGRLQLGLTTGSILTLLNDVTVDSALVFSGGLLDLNNHRLDLLSTGVLTNETELSRAFSNGTGYIEATRVLHQPSQFNAGNLGAVITSSADLGTTIIRRGHAVQNNIYGSNHSVFRYYDIIPTTNTALNATLRFQYFQGELDGINEDTLGLWSSNDNVSWSQIGYSARDTVNNYVEKTAIGSFSRATLSQFINTAGFRNISITNNPSSTEGDVGTKELKFTVKLNASTASTVQVNYTTLDSTATNATDYVLSSGTLTFTPGQVADTIRVLINGDGDVEPDEYFLVQLSSAVNANITSGRARGTIRNDDNYPAITISNYTVVEGNTTDTTLLVKVRLNKTYPSPVSVTYATQDSTATAGIDYVPATGVLTFIPGDTLEFIPVTIHGDRIDEPNEIININLSNPVNATLASNVRGRVTIADDDPFPQVIFTNTAIAEGSNDQFNNVSFTVRLNHSYPLPVTLRYRTQDSTASAGSDYLTAQGVINFDPGDTLESIVIPIMGDRIAEPNEIIKLVLDSVTNATVSAPSYRITINNDDQIPQITFTNSSVNEGSNDQYNNASFTVRLNRSYPLPVTVSYQTQDSTAVSGSDYQAVSGLITFVPGDTVESFVVPVLGDRVVESNEIIKLLLSGPTNGTISSSSSRITITNDDSYPVMNINNLTITEGDAGTANAQFTVRISKHYPQDISVQYNTQDVTATAGLDYLTTNGSLVFAADGDTVQTITVPILGDLIDEANETFKVQLSAVVNATLGGGGSAVGTITDNDPVPAIRAFDTTATEASGNAAVRVSLNNPSGKTVSVAFKTQEGTALDTLDYTRIVSDTLVFLPGETTKFINVPIIADLLTEGNETFSVILQSPVNGTVTTSQGGDNTAIVTIVNSAPPSTTRDNSSRGISDEFSISKIKAVDKLEVTTSPNPFRNNLQFTITSPETGRLKILIYDINGVKAGELERDVIRNIPATILFRSQQFRQGVLLYRVIVNKLSLAGKLIQVN